jgi:hypothetical protein
VTLARDLRGCSIGSTLIEVSRSIYFPYHIETIAVAPGRMNEARMPEHMPFGLIAVVISIW